MTAPPSVPSPHVEIRSFGPRMAPRIADISDLHERLLPASPIVKLGKPFMQRFYYSVLPAEGHVFGAVAYVDSKPAGFIVAAADSHGFMRRAAKQHFFSLAWLIGTSLLLSPRRVCGLLSAWRIMRARAQTPSGEGGLGEILSIGVLAEYTQRALRRQTGVHLAGRLMAHALGELRSKGVESVGIVVDTDNRRAREFYESFGFHPRTELPKGWPVPSLEYILDLAAWNADAQWEGGSGNVEATPVAAKDVTVVVPCYNEEAGLAALAVHLASLRSACNGNYRLYFVFVDDGSADDTWMELHRVFGIWRDCEFVRHAANRGIAAAILTGLERAQNEVVCSIDCDCSYDPRQLLQMIPLLREGVAMVTASPHHPSGRVAGVPAWRLVLSRGVSMLYRVVLGGRLHTYTSCFRVYRRSAVSGMRLSNYSFLGVTEMLHRIAAREGTIVEHPATLEARTTGASKAEVLPTALDHLRLLARLLHLRLTGKLNQA